MKLKTLGHKLASYQTIVIFSLVGLPISFHFEWYYVFTFCMIVFFIYGVKAMNISIDTIGNPGMLYEFEPGDKEYEEEDDEDIEINIKIDVKTKD